MKSKIRNIFMILILFTSLILTVSCSDGKSPEPGYVSGDYITSEVVSKFSSQSYTRYSYEGSLNFLGYTEETVPGFESNVRSNKAYTEATNMYNSSMVSAYLRVPLQINQENWDNVTNSDGVVTATLSTRYNLEAKIYQPAGGYLDTIYYYTRDGGGFILKSFGVNKNLRINSNGIEAHGKWNVSIEYDKNGYLVSEKFESLNAHKEDDSKSIYGYCEYKFS